MNIYYLKKFRKEAQKRIKARCNPSFLGDENPYDCLEDGFYIRDSLSKDLFKLQQKLSGYRRNYILKLTQAERAKRLNKYLSKL